MSGVAQFLKDFGPAFAWIIAAIGWTLSNYQANTREKRKEFRAEIVNIESTLSTVIDKLSTYFHMRKRDEAAKVLEIEIVGLFKSIDTQCERLAKRQKGGDLGLYVDEINAFREDFYDYATGRYFETAWRVPLKNLSTHVQGLHGKASLLVESLHTLFLAKFDGIKKVWP